MINKRNVFLIALLITVVAMAVGYATLAQTLTINGTANVSADWNVKITNISENSLVGAKLNGTPSYNSTSATFNVDLEYPGASASFNVIIENTGTIDAKLDSISGVDSANSAAPTYIKYEITGVNVNDNLQASTGRATATVKVMWDASQDTVPEGQVSKTATITLNYVQAI